MKTEASHKAVRRAYEETNKHHATHEADTTKVFAFDNGDLHPQLRAANSSHIATGACPNNNQIKGSVSHVAPSHCSVSNLVHR